MCDERESWCSYCQQWTTREHADQHHSQERYERSDEAKERERRRDWEK